MRRFTSLPRTGIALLLAITAASHPRPAHAWGAGAHHYIAQHYSQDLPAVIDGLRAYDSVVDTHVTDPDTRKSSTPGESPKHFIDIDVYPEFLAGTLTHSRSALEAEYGAQTVLDNGVLPWAIGDVMTTLTQQFQGQLWSAAALTIADLCHYAGDATQPLHCTANYDGGSTGDSGIHSRYETSMLSTYLSSVSTPAQPARYYAGVVDTMFRVITESQSDVNAIMVADKDAKAVSGGSYNSTYYARLWLDTGAMTQARLDSAAVTTASLVYTAWMNAGRPVVPGSSASVALASPAGIALVAGPTPFRELLSIRYSGNGPMAVDVFDVRGVRVARLANGEASSGNVSWRPGAAGSRPGAGIYFVRLSGPHGSTVRRVTLLD